MSAFEDQEAPLSEDSIILRQPNRPPTSFRAEWRWVVLLILFRTRLRILDSKSQSRSIGFSKVKNSTRSLQTSLASRGSVSQPTTLLAKIRQTFVTKLDPQIRPIFSFNKGTSLKRFSNVRIYFYKQKSTEICGRQVLVNKIYKVTNKVSQPSGIILILSVPWQIIDLQLERWVRENKFIQGQRSLLAMDTL